LSDSILQPVTEWELRGMMVALAERRIAVEVAGAGTKRACGRPLATGAAITTSRVRGITLYEPTELVMSARSGTTLVEVESELAARGQMLPFEPIDLGPILGQMPGQQTIGGVFATNVSGSRRASAGSARDYLLGLKAVNGRGEEFKSGGRVMKNVTGYDVARGLAGSWGTLAVFTELTFKVLPLPDNTLTLVYQGLTGELAGELMSAAMGSPFEVTGTVHLSDALVARLSTAGLNQGGKSLTFIRLENFTKSLHYRKERLKTLLTAYGTPLELDLDPSLKLWGELRRLSVFPHGPSHIWRISTVPIWIEVPPTADAGAADIRRAVSNFGGHATLIRAAENVRREVQVFQPLSPGFARITEGLKAAFDPLGLLNPGRMYVSL
jgi:glycolate oxidase FAD binding subunit